VNIALANELALICEVLGVDVVKVIEAAHTDPKTHILTPGPGVGGYCLPKDPYYLTQPASEAGFEPRLIPTARMVNEDMPLHVARLVEDALQEAGLKIRGSTVAVLGLAFKGNSGDLRNTPVLPIVRALEERGVGVKAYDPLVDPDEARAYFGGIRLAGSVEEAVEDASCILVAADHVEFRRLRLQRLLDRAGGLRAVVDTRHILDPDEVRRVGLAYRGVGRGQRGW